MSKEVTSKSESRRSFLGKSTMGAAAGSGAAVLKVLTGATTVRRSDRIRKVVAPNSINQKS